MRFELTEDHVKLLQNAFTGWNDCEYGSPGIDCKRPYGSKHVHRDMAKILGIKATDEEGFAFSEEDMKRMNKLHKEMETVLLVAFRTLKVEPGEYNIDGFKVAKAKPKYYVRPDDFMVFSLNSDECTYSIMSSKIKYPDHLHHEYTEERLVANGFFIGRKEDFPEYSRRQEAFYKRMGEMGKEDWQA